MLINLDMAIGAYDKRGETMTNHVWCANIFADIEPFAAYCPIAETSEDRKKFLGFSPRILAGIALDPSHFPLVLRAMDDEAESLSHYNYSSGHLPLISTEMVEVLHELDIGTGQFSEVHFEDLHGAALPYDHRLWQFGNRRNTLVVDKCRNVFRLKSTNPNFPESYSLKNREMDNDDIALNQDALNGPDIWVEALFSKAIFFSNRAKKLLDDKGFGDVFLFKSVRVIETTDFKK